MNKRPQYLVLCCAAGLAAGSGLRVAREKAVTSATESVAAATSPAPSAARTPGEPPARDAGALTDARPSLETVIAAEGWDQLIQLVAWLPTATPIELDRLFQTWAATPRWNFDAPTSRALFLRWMEVEPRAALAAARLKPDALGTAWWAWAKNDPDAAWSAVSGSNENRFIGRVLAAIAETDPGRVTALLDGHPEWDGHYLQSSLARHAARTDLEAGVELAWRGGIDETADRLLRTFAAEDPDGALAWALTKAQLEWRAVVLDRIFTQLHLTDPERVGPAIEALPPSRSRQHAFAQHAARLALDDPEAAHAWAVRGSTVEERTHALTAAAHALVDHDPDAAVALLQSLDRRSSLSDRTTVATTPAESSTEAPSSGQISEMVEDLDYHSFKSLPGVITELSEHRPEAVVEASLRLEETPERARLLESIFTTWAGNDAAALSEWVITQPESAVRHEATTTLVTALSEGQDPDFRAAVRWAATLPDDDLLKGTLMSWETRNPEAPARALPTLGLSADRVPGLLEFLRLNAQPDSSDPTPDP